MVSKESSLHVKKWTLNLIQLHN